MEEAARKTEEMEALRRVAEQHTEKQQEAAEPAVEAEEVAMDSPVFAATRPARSPGDALRRLDEVLHEAVARRVCPGAAVACGSCGHGASSSLQYFSKGTSP
jgi:hypothetical protein